MHTLIQRTQSASVHVNHHVIGQIQQGILALVGFHSSDNTDTIKSCIDKIRDFRIFSDQDDKMNLSLKDIQGGLLLVPQFTLVADTSRGRRPSFSTAASAEQGLSLFNQLYLYAQSTIQHVEKGEFGANMAVELINDGPVTFHFVFE